MLWFHCDTSTGAIMTAGVAANESDANLNQAPSGQVLLVVPDGTVGSPFTAMPDFSVLKAHLRAKIDIEAGAARSPYVSDVPGQAQTYEKKEAEARQWTEGDEVAHPERYPFMLKEAEVRSIPIAQVQAEIMVQVNLLTPLAAIVEAHRVAAKQNILEATTLPTILAASVVDWASLLPAG